LTDEKQSRVFTCPVEEKRLSVTVSYYIILNLKSVHAFIFYLFFPLMSDLILLMAVTLTGWSLFWQSILRCLSVLLTTAHYQSGRSNISRWCGPVVSVADGALCDRTDVVTR